MTIPLCFILFPSVFYVFVHKLRKFLNSTSERQPSECNATGTEVGCHLSLADSEQLPAHPAFSWGWVLVPASC